MEDSKKKWIMIGILVVCAVAAVGVTIATRSTGGSGLKSGMMMWVKCSDPQCGKSYEMDKKEYFDYVKDQQQKGVANVKLTCKECGKQTVMQAVKCEQCKAIFFYGAVRNDLGDRCPECGYSNTDKKVKEVKKKKAPVPAGT